MSDSEDEFEDAVGNTMRMPVTLDQVSVETFNLFYKEHVKLMNLKKNFITPLTQNDFQNENILKRVNDLWKEHETLEKKASKMSSTMRQWKSYKRYTFDMRKKLKEKILSQEEVKKDLAKYFVELSFLNILRKNLFKNWYQDFRLTNITEQRRKEIIWKDNFDVIDFLEKEYVVAATKVKKLRREVVQLNKKIHNLKKKKYEQIEMYNDKGNKLERCKAKVKVVEDIRNSIKTPNGTPIIMLYNMYQEHVADQVLNTVENISIIDMWALMEKKDKNDFVKDAYNKYKMFFQYVLDNHSNPRIVLYQGYQKDKEGILKQLTELYNNVHVWDFESLDIQDDDTKFVTLATYFYKNRNKFITREMMKMKLMFFLLRLSNFYKEERFLNKIKNSKLQGLTVKFILTQIFSQLQDHKNIISLAEHMTWYYDDTMYDKGGETLSDDKKEFIFAGFIDRYFSSEENDMLFEILEVEKNEIQIHNLKF